MTLRDDKEFFISLPPLDEEQMQRDISLRQCIKEELTAAYSVPVEAIDDFYGSSSITTVWRFYTAMQRLQDWLEAKFSETAERCLERARR